MRTLRPRIRRLLRGAAALPLVAAAVIVGVKTAGPAQAADVPPNPIEKPGWTLERNDEFNGSLDSSLWITNYLESRTPESRSRARYHFRDNALVLRIDDDQPTYYSDNPMKVSSIQTGQRTGLHKGDRFDHNIPTLFKYAPQYGYFEIRAKSSARHGVHTAWWTVGKQDTNSQHAEIDMLEHGEGRHGLNCFYFNLHKWFDNTLPETINTICPGFNVTTDFHIYGLEWTPTQLKLYVDNVLRHTINAAPRYPSAFLLGIYENAGWNGTVNPRDTQPKEFIVDYFRAYQKADGPTPTPTPTDGTGGLVSGATYKIKNVASGGYLDSDANGVLSVASANAYDDQDWVASQQSNGSWTFRNVRSGRYYVDTESNNAVIWNDGYVGPDSQWRVEPAAGGLRLDNDRSDRGYLYGTSAGQVRWNTGSADASTVWAFERK
jgi:hypothetical protein